MPGQPDVIELWELYLPGTRLDRDDAWRSQILRVSLWRHRDGTGWSVELFTPQSPQQYHTEPYATEVGAREALSALDLLGDALGIWVKKDTSWETMIREVMARPTKRSRKGRPRGGYRG